jgi:hypothetical protein
MKGPIGYEWLLPLAPWESPESLQKVLASLSAQTWQAGCLVVSVDGVLPEHLRQVLVDSGLPLRIVEAPCWQGTGAVLARGIEACSARWVLRSDADDLSHPMRAEWQLRHLDRHPHLAVLGGQLAEAVNNRQSVEVRNVPASPTAILRLMRWRNPMNHPTVALRRDAVLAAGNYRTCPAFEDWDLWLRMSLRGFEFANLEQPVVTAAVGEAHLARRHGWRYLQRESRFLLRCGHEGLLPLAQVFLLMLLRLPWRLLPSGWLAGLMRSLRSSRKEGVR